MRQTRRPWTNSATSAAMLSLIVEIIYSSEKDEQKQLPEEGQERKGEKRNFEKEQTPDWIWNMKLLMKNMIEMKTRSDRRIEGKLTKRKERSMGSLR